MRHAAIAACCESCSWMPVLQWPTNGEGLMRFAPLCIGGLLTALACARGGDEAASRVLASTPGDSAGWRSVSVPALGLRLQYPESHVRAVVDQSTRDCPSVPRLPAAAW